MPQNERQNGITERKFSSYENLLHRYILASYRSRNKGFCYHNWRKEDGTFVETEIGKIEAESSGVAKNAICANSTIDNCTNVVYCKL